MLAFVSPFNDPVIHLGLEAYFLDHCDEPVLLLYRNRPSVIIGKNQNPLSEVNLPFVTRNGISWHRRMSGGGTVYHDSGNFNYAFIGRREGIHESLYQKYTQPLVDWVCQLGLNGGLDGRNGVVVDGLKISGTAQCLRRHRFLHHGTCLVESDLDKLEASINTALSPVIDNRGIASVRSRVTRLADLLHPDWTMQDWLDCIVDYWEGRFDTRFMKTLPEDALQYARKEAESLHASRVWRVERSPRFEARHSVILGEQRGILQFEVREGRIQGLFAEGMDVQAPVVELFQGQLYERESLLLLSEKASAMLGKSWRWPDELESLSGLS